ncbi:hypothetical protein MCOR27_006783 [Pyricularia oryzae]|uniref:RRM domain-containing protein n=2 Tax=Pyricularia TaxID=48558 RepID=A0ABQ8NU40_PYRGI|nr:hypothetical protein MCOR27_006783 [Pyricularia oryzae]KAI6281109.1 hypothetical protein MCOR26_003473 [Pyricularia oryzae]KAI6300828.1 hypothetical protein MCOR33_003572 [Pyricularia grisea]KAI6434759.1 hypothetical protein MCOR24_000921 [Pyricularia oryzae]KAI6551818.1 hypothetical protein MCOR04_011014 [Pyricularia oryzae]
MLNPSVFSRHELDCIGIDLAGIVLHGPAESGTFDLRSCRRPLADDLDVQQTVFRVLPAKQRAFVYRCVTSIDPTGADDLANTPSIGSPRLLSQYIDLLDLQSTATSSHCQCDCHRQQLPLPPSTWPTFTPGPTLHAGGWGPPQMTSSSVLVSPYGNSQQHSYSSGHSYGVGSYSTTGSEYDGSYGYSHDTEYMAPYGSGYQYDCNTSQAHYMQQPTTAPTSEADRAATRSTAAGSDKDGGRGGGEYITGLVQRRIIISKLHHQTQHQDVKKLLEKVHGVLKIKLHPADGKRDKKCHALVTLDTHEAANNAIARLEGKTLKGRVIQVRLAVELQRPHRPQQHHVAPSSSGGYAPSSSMSYSPEGSYSNAYTQDTNSVYSIGDGGDDSLSGRSYRRRGSHKSGSKKDHPMVVDGTIG